MWQLPRTWCRLRKCVTYQLGLLYCAQHQFASIPANEAYKLRFLLGGSAPSVLLRSLISLPYECASSFNSALAIYNSWGDAGSVAFVLAADAALVLLFLCLREFERGGRGRDAKIKAAVWALTTLLTAMFASRVAPLMPPPVAAVVWLLAVATAAGGFWAFFLN
ncbi:uncharacterized protein [Miscanthus floridulus]|uniref:uncharacterized protein n=1 Tax=Miscanthus floridulus TaxID=154761 RepID=UPI00345A8847